MLNIIRVRIPDIANPSGTLRSNPYKSLDI